MKSIKDELQNIIFGDEQTGSSERLKKAQIFLRGYAQASSAIKEQQHFKDKEAAALLAFATTENLLYADPILSTDFISEGAEQQVYRFDNSDVLKINRSDFYESWFDYLNSLLIHNFFFPTTAYTLLVLN